MPGRTALTLRVEAPAPAQAGFTAVARRASAGAMSTPPAFAERTPVIAGRAGRGDGDRHPGRPFARASERPRGPFRGGSALTSRTNARPPGRASASGRSGRCGWTAPRPDGGRRCGSPPSVAARRAATRPAASAPAASTRSGRRRAGSAPGGRDRMPPAAGIGLGGAAAARSSRGGRRRRTCGGSRRRRPARPPGAAPAGWREAPVERARAPRFRAWGGGEGAGLRRRLGGRRRHQRGGRQRATGGGRAAVRRGSRPKTTAVAPAARPTTKTGPCDEPPMPRPAR